jgi:hypothetical protein
MKVSIFASSPSSVRLSDLIYSGTLANKTVAAATMTSFIGSPSEVNSPVSIKPMEREGDLTNLLDEISYKRDFEDVPDLPRQNGGSKDNIYFNNNFDSEEDLTDPCDSVSYGSEDEWMSNLELQDDDPTIFSSKLNNNNTARH